MAGSFPISAYVMSGYCVGEWLPHTVMRRTSRTCASAFLASCALARLWSRRIMAVNRSRGMSGALFIAIRQLVFAGLPTTSTFTSSAAFSLSALPWTVKIAPLASSSSERSMPFVRGRAPTSSAMLHPATATFGSSVISTPATSGNALSSSSIATPSSAPMACGTSSSRSSTKVSSPSTLPLAMRGSSA